MAKEMFILFVYDLEFCQSEREFSSFFNLKLF
jgi:hypothetical protein